MRTWLREVGCVFADVIAVAVISWILVVVCSADRDPHHERRASGATVADLQVATLALHQLVGDVEADALARGPWAAGAPVEDAPTQRVVHPRPVVVYGDLDRVTDPVDRHLGPGPAVLGR